ncbi:hypothetical protein GCM10009682_47280 [Luedemannella flava]|uniref:Transposase n=1 Tax=Luedemannella flava TaxID=349316 RepID=A0ABP4YKL0_9ACTN
MNRLRRNVITTRPARDGHPYWCARDHSCTAYTLPTGEHRSDLLVWATPYGKFIATRVRTRAGKDRLELRAVVRLDPNQRTAHHQAQRLVIGMDLAVRDALVAATRPGRKAAA